MAKKPTPPSSGPVDGSPPWDTEPAAMFQDDPPIAASPPAPSLDGGLFGDAAPHAVPYVVLARKYRPQAFPDLIGQDAMVQTLRNAFATGRIAQGYMLTGVRGVGKTTTARILARGLNYETDTVSAPTVDMPVLGRHCAEIIASRHPDVVEMDAASNTGIDNIREIIDGSRYRPIAARTKVYIIDEVHMLSKGAFNALLKTLEEPPEHVKFIFATTEVRKVPVTVLSRCQRFDLRRVDVPVLSAHLKAITAKEGATADDDAIAMIARAAEGSVRDSLSILDQAIAMSGSGASAGAGAKPVTASLVRAMLGLSDRGRILDLVETLASGNIANALGLLDALHRDGADPVQVLADLAEAVHVVTRMKVLTADTGSDALSADEKRRIKALGQSLSVPLLSRYWQMLQKGHAEAAQSGDAHAAAEMVLIRLAHTADLPSPDDLIRMLGGDAPQRRSLSVAASPTASNDGPRSNAVEPVGQPLAAPPPASRDAYLTSDLDPDIMRADDPGSVRADDPGSMWVDDPGAGLDDGAGEEVATPGPVVATIQSFADVVDLASRMRDAKLKVDLEEQVSLVKFDAATGSIDIFLHPAAPGSLPNDLREKLNRWTARKWFVMVSKREGEPTLGSLRRAREAKDRAIIEQHPTVRAMLDTFPGIKIAAIRRQTVARDDDTGDTGTGTG
ncbi:MAG: DNA polymerase III subunit gamma/tau [Hyphomicrobium aestuarii]|nr:DNA polymerase III subunit gamma/tau [Hyphomicrobium aestuarii]